MKTTILTLCILSFSPMAYAASCITKVGDKVAFDEPQKLVQDFEARSKDMPILDKYITEKDYRAQVAKLDQLLSTEVYRVLGGTTQSLQPYHYDSENKRFEIHQSNWGSEVPSTAGPFAASSHSMYLGINIQEFIAGLDGTGKNQTYEATNAFGASTTVTISNTNHYAIYDRARGMNDLTWKGDFFGAYDGRGVYLNATPEVARQLDKTLLLAVEFSPKAPLIAAKSLHKEPTLSRPIAETMKLHTFIGNLRCLLVTDKDGVVLQRMVTNY